MLLRVADEDVGRRPGSKFMQHILVESGVAEAVDGVKAVVPGRDTKEKSVRCVHFECVG